jgi:2Fe-2S ferredoxin
MKITFVHPDGVRQSVDARPGQSAMEVAVANGIKGIVAECGGSAMCATCHVHVDNAFVEVTGQRAEIEEEMLEVAASPRQPSSRLSCQIRLTEEMDGLVLHLPEAQ